MLAIDAAGNVDPTPASYTWTVDTVPPDTIIDTNPSDPSKESFAQFHYTGLDDNPGELSFECKLDNGDFAGCPLGSTFYGGLADGLHTFQVRAIDAAGNADQFPAQFTWTVDTIPPDTAINAHPANPSGLTSASFGFTGSDAGGTGVATLQCQLDGGGYSTCSSPKSYSGLADGQHTFQVRATDAAGNVDQSSASYTWVVDLAGPTLTPTVTPNPVNLGGTATASAGASDPSGVASSSCGPIDTSTVGVKTVTCTATDTLGNSSSKSVTYTVKFGFLGFDNPIPQSNYKAGSTIPVKFGLASNAGTKITDSAAQALAAGCSVKVRLDAASPTVCATYDTKSKTFQADFKVAKGLSGADHINVDVYAPSGSGLVQTETEPITIKA